jgi:hypothetical protein
VLAISSRELQPLFSTHSNKGIWFSISSTGHAETKLQLFPSIPHRAVPTAQFVLKEVDFHARPLRVDKQKENRAVLIVASIVATIRLRGEGIKPSPKLNAVVHDSILLARTILAQKPLRRGGSRLNQSYSMFGMHHG